MMFKYMCLVLFITWYQLADCHPASSNVKTIDSMIEKESDAFLSVEAEDSSHKNVRDKRTIGFLRQLFPNLSQIVDRKIQQITRFVFRVIGRLVLRGGGAGAGAGAGGTAAAGTGGDSGNGGRRISITLPTFPPSTDDEDEDAQTNVPVADTSSTPASDTDALASRILDTPSSEATATDSAPAASADSAAAADSASEVVVTTSDPAASTAAVTNAAPVITTAGDAAATPVTNAAPAAGTVATTTIAAATAAAATATANAISSPTTQMPSDSDNTVGTGIVKRTARDVSTDEPSSAKKRSPLTDTGKI